MRKNFYFKTTFFTLLFITTEFYSMAQWTADLTLNTSICNVAGSQRDARILEDGSGGAFIVWKDSRTGVPDIYVQRVNSAGIALWTINGVGACTNSSDQSTPSIVYDMAGGVIVTWSDWRSGIERDIYAMRIDGNGNMLWTANGAIVTDKTEREHNERIISDGNGGCIIAWEQQNTSTWTWEIWAQRMNSNGVRMWGNGGKSLCLNSTNKRNPKLQADQNGGGYITWQDLRNGVEYDIYAQRVDINGNLLWGNTALAVCAATNDQNNPKIDPDTITGGVYIAWADERVLANGHDIYCQRIDANGNFLWTVNGVSVCAAAGSQTAVDIMAEANIDGVFLTWKDDRSGSYTDIYAQRLNASGVPQWTTNGVAVCTSPLVQRNPNISYDENGGAVIVWEDSTAASSNDIKAQRINASGVPQWTANGVVVSNNSAMQKAPKSVSDKTGGVIAVWDDYRTGARDIYAQRIYANGTPVSVEEAENPFSDFTVYPNPFSEKLTVEYSLAAEGETSLAITAIDGREVFSRKAISQLPGIINQVEIPTGDLADGIYFITVQYGTQTITAKMIRQ